MSELSYWDLDGDPIVAELYEGDLDVSALGIDHPTGEISKGQPEMMCEIINADEQRGFWATPKRLAEHASPLGPEAEDIAVEYGNICPDCGEDRIETRRKVGGKKDRVCTVCGWWGDSDE